MELINYLTKIGNPYDGEREEITKDHLLFENNRDVIELKRLRYDEKIANEIISEEELALIYEVTSDDSFQRYYIFASDDCYTEYFFVYLDSINKYFFEIVDYFIKDGTVYNKAETYLNEEDDDSPYIKTADSILNFEKKHGRHRLRLITSSQGSG